MRFWVITKIGKKASSGINPPSDTDGKVLEYLHEVKTASTEDIAAYVGTSSSRMSSVLGKLSRRRLVNELTREDGIS